MMLVSHSRHFIVRYTREFISKRSLARLLSTLLCSIAIAIRPFARLGGHFPFLVLALKELVFSVQGSLAQQLELTVLNIMGALLGVGLSTLAKFGASKTAPNSASGRAICAIALIVISFLAGLTKSRLPRLQLSARISCFVSVWILTVDIGLPSRVLPDSGAFLWIALTAAILCLISLILVMLPFRWTPTNFETEVAGSLSALHECLTMALHWNFTDNLPSSIDRDVYTTLQSQLFTTSIKLNEAYSQAAFELRAGRISLRSIRPLIIIIEHIRRELAWGMQLKQAPEVQCHSKEDHTTSELFIVVVGPTAQTLGHAILHAMSCVESTVICAFRRQEFTLSSPVEVSHTAALESQLEVIREAQKQLASTTQLSQSQFDILYKDINMGEGSDGSPIDVPTEIYDGSLALIGLLQMAAEATTALHVAERLVNLYLESPSRLWYPRISLAWFGVPPGPFISDDTSHSVSMDLAIDQQMLSSMDVRVLSDNERQQGLAEYAKRLAKGTKEKREDALQDDITEMSRTISHTKGMWARFVSSVRWLWVNHRTLDFRVKLWLVHRSLKNSHHLQHALKNAVGVALLTFPAFMSSSSPGYRWYQDWHGQWMTISYLWVLETNTGATWRTGYLRILGTCIGAIYAYVVWAICRNNPYGLIVLVTAADVPLTWLITKTDLTPLAVPCSVAIPPIAFAKYSEPELTQPIIILALLRALMITAGMVAALLMNSLVFPRHCRVLFLSHTSKTFGLLSSLYLTLSHEMFNARNAWVPDDRRKTLKLEFQARNELHRLSALITCMKDELGLLPKPLRRYRKVVTNMQKLLDLLTGLRKIRENIPRQETVVDVFNERRAFMSCICILLYACQHVFRTREPLPQFLPSARHALGNLERHIHDCLRKAHTTDSPGFGVSLAYVFAEQETMRNMVDTLEKLLKLSGDLFGTLAWLTQDASWTTGIVDEGKQGWYSTLEWDNV